MPAYDAIQFSPPAPIAKVVLRNLTSRSEVTDVPMLIDTGADITLLPQSFVERLGISIDTLQGYEVMGFDGNKSVAPFVEAECVFLARNFKGRFLTINQECGIIGRDVLNHVSLLFNGIALEWSEK